MEYKINKCNHNIKKFIKDIIHQDFNIDYWDEWLDEQELWYYKYINKKKNYLMK